jgi:2-phospho-L-lactate guanylyltransferase
VRRVLVVCEDARVPAGAARHRRRVCRRARPARLNPALEFGASVLRAGDQHGAIGALQADLPALRPADLGRRWPRRTGAGRSAPTAPAPAPRCCCSRRAGRSIPGSASARPRAHRGRRRAADPRAGAVASL